MISAGLVSMCIGIVLVLMGILIVIALILNKNNIWKHPVIIGIYASLVIYFFVSGAIFIYQITITNWMILISVILMLIYFATVSRLLAKRER